MEKLPKFARKYRNGTFRCTKWDYTSGGFYLVTICTKHRSLDFGDVVQGEMVLNDIGNIVEQHWMQIPLRFSCMTLDEYIIMPDHIHGIIQIEHGDNCRCVSSKRTYNKFHPRYDYEGYHPRMSQISSHSSSISVAIRLFKGDCTKSIRAINPEFQWQRRFHDRIVRNEHELRAYRRYIRNNPKNWHQ